MAQMKIVMLGGGAVGKSALTVQEVSDSYRTSINVDGECVSIDILDTAGQEEYLALRDSYIRGGDAFVIVYSITSEVSFIEANGVREQIYRILDKDSDEKLPICLVGNKCDLESERRVMYDEAKKLADEWGVQFLEASAKEKINVNEIFVDLARMVLKERADNKLEESVEMVVQKKKKKKITNNCSLL
ncbi:small monomeric GTPase [Entamoeba marina]